MHQGHSTVCLGRFRIDIIIDNKNYVALNNLIFCINPKNVSSLYASKYIKGQNAVGLSRFIPHLPTLAWDIT